MRCLPESPTRYNAEPPDQVARIKKHPALLRMLELWVDQQAAQIGAEIAQTLAPGTPVPGAALVEWNRLVMRALVPRLSGFASWLRKADLEPSVRVALEGIARRWKKRADDCVLDWAELLTDPVFLTAGFAAFSTPGDVKKSEIERLVAWMRRQLATPQKAPVDEEGSPVLDAEGQPLELDGEDPAGRFDDEDDPILLRLVQLKRGGLMPAGGEALSWEHVAIDEAQDRSALEVKVLLEAVHAPGGEPAKRSVTIAGDTAQRLVFDNNFSGWDELLAHLRGTPPLGSLPAGQAAIVRPLKLSYRSTAEVMMLAREILGPELAPEDPVVARSGEPVELHEFGDLGEAVAFLADALRNLMAREPTASCAVIARHPEQADAYFEGLRRAEIPALRRVRRDEFNFQPGVDITDVAQVKGLEFDYVVMVDINTASYPEQRWARHMLHIGVTRAAHQLWLISVGEPSHLIPAALRDGGRMV
jgi:DNA helicase-2/ATP-dependent DNA helicase PcrA